MRFGDDARFALSLAVEQDGFPAEASRFGRGGIERRAAAGDDAVVRVPAPRFFRLYRFAPAPVGRGDTVAKEDGSSVGEAGRVRHGGAGAYVFRPVADDVGHGERCQPRRKRRAGEAAALDSRQVAADGVHLADRSAGAEKGGGEGLLLRQRQAFARKAGERGGAAAQQDEDEIVGTGLSGEAEQALGGRDARFVRDGMAGGDAFDPVQRRGAAVRNDGQAGERTGPMSFHRARHAARRLAHGKDDGTARRRLRQVGRDDARGVAGGDGRAEDAFEVPARRHRPMMIASGRFIKRRGAASLAAMATRATWRRAGRILARGVGALLLVPLLYLLAMAAGGLLTANAGWQEPEEGVTLFVRTNGVHTWILVPTVTADVDWRPLAPASHIREPRLAGNYLAIGFGNRDFYLNTPTWADLSLRTAFSAAVGGGPSLMHVDHETDPVEDEWTRRLTIGRDEYRRLARHIRDSFQLDEAGRTMPLIGRGYGWSDVFYESRLAYNFIRTCNEWTGEALRTAGVRAGVWTPTAQSIMWRLGPADG